jgi:hypothetical protein
VNAPFVPLGEQARWKTAYEVLTRHVVGDVVTYVEIGEALDLDPDTDRHAIQMTLRRAAREFEEHDLHALDTIPNTGYRIVEPPEHLTLARGQQKRSSKALMRGQSKVVNVDFTGMDPEIRKAFEVTAHAFGSMIDMQRRMYKRQSDIEVTLSETSQRQDRSEGEVKELRDRLARLERDNGVGS